MLSRMTTDTTSSSGHTADERLPLTVRERLARLATDQRGAATSAPGPILCVAPAGSGKTTTLVARIAWRVAGGVHPGAICALTFNRRAAEELQERADAALGELGLPPGSVRVRTFHALGRAILAEAGVDVSRIVERQALLTELAGGPLPAPAQRWLDDAFTRLKLDPERAPPPADVATHEAFVEYQAALTARGAIDLDDLVARAVPALLEDAALLSRWRDRAAVLFVDEAQDLDRSQLELALLLAGDRRDIFLVGDDDQTIYAWRLADVRRVLDLAARVPGLRRVDLETNHRCAPEVVRRAARLVAHNRERFDKVIRASPTAWGSVTLLPDEGDAVARARLLLSRWPWEAGAARTVPAHPSNGGIVTAGRLDASSRRAVLARTNAELVPFAAVALELSIPCQVEEDGLILEQPGLLEVVERAMGTERAGVRPLAALASAIGECGLATASGAALLAWAAPYDRLCDLAQDLRARQSARLAQAGQAEGASLTLATFHATKGLEWDHVACIGHDEGSFPAERALCEAVDPVRALEEERRLAYVAWTRARHTLTLVYDPGAPSAFLREAFDPSELAPDRR
jgi:DNA helicase II / ATP-dependent DNA helicase PcrA